MRLLTIVHEDTDGPGVFIDAARSRGAELVAWEIARGAPVPADFDAVITLGGAANTNESLAWIAAEREFLASLVEEGVPLLAVCLGAQVLGEAIGGSVERMPVSEIGWYPVSVAPAGVEDPLLGRLAPSFDALEWHHYELSLPADAVVLARTPACIQAYRVGAAAWGVQFHPEVTLADFTAWVDGYRRGEDTGGLDFDPDQLLASTRERIVAWNALGRELCGRFIDAAAVATAR
jgi:GMP synthase-like glutamine amidotransferase